MSNSVSWINRRVSADEFFRQLHQSETDWLFISSEPIEQGEPMIAGRDAAVVWLRDCSTSLLCRLPLWLRLFAFPSQWDGFFVHRDVAQHVSPGATASEAAEEWLLRALTSGTRIEAIGSALQTSEVSFSPALRPSFPTRPWLKPLLEKFRPETFAKSVRSSIDLTALKAGIFQMHDFFDESHSFSQSIEGAGVHRNGDYWHAIMHRREPDPGNAKYWFRHVGRHPIFNDLSRELTQRINELHTSADRKNDELISRMSHLVDGRDEWDPFAFVDFCRTSVERGHPEEIAVAEALQGDEMSLLLAATLDDALIVD